METIYLLFIAFSTKLKNQYFTILVFFYIKYAALMFFYVKYAVFWKTQNLKLAIFLANLFLIIFNLFHTRIE